MSVVAVIGSLAAIFTAIFGVYKLVIWSILQTPEQKKEAIDKAISEEQDKVKTTGRPQ